MQSLERENGESTQKLPATIPTVRTSLLMRSSQSKRYQGINLFGGEAQTQQNSGRGSLERLDNIKQAEESPRKLLNDQRQDSQDKMLKDLNIRMSINNAKKSDINKNAFSLLRTSLEASQNQVRNSLAIQDNKVDSSVFKQVRGIPADPLKGADDEAQTLTHRRKYQSTYDVKALLSNRDGRDNNAEAQINSKASVQQIVRQSRVDADTIEGKKVATVKDRARLRDLIKNI